MSQGKGLQEGEWEFTFPNNGDVYKGHYCAHVSGLAWRQGPGIYVTHDGQTYEGNWKDDKLNEAENLQITFQNTEKYNGKIHKYKYNGPGTYTFPNGSRLTCNFVNNKPTGEIIYIDHHDELWYGKAGPEHVLLTKEHVFSHELDGRRGKGRSLLKLPEEETAAPEQSSDEISFTMKELEEIVFEKSSKTVSAIDFNDSDWLRDYEKFTEIRKRVLDKVATRGASSLTEDEKLWYKQYLQSAKLVQDTKGKKLKKMHKDLLRQYFDDEMKNTTCPPTVVLHGTHGRGWEEGGSEFGEGGLRG